MPIQTWLATLNAQSNELKLASGLALATVIIVFAIVAASLVFNAPDKPNENVFTTQSHVSTIDKPNLPSTAPQPTKKISPIKPQTQKLKNNTQTQPIAEQKNKKPTTKKSQVKVGQGNFYIQVGAFSQAKLARLMLDKMKAKYIYAKIKQKKDKHAVWVGPVITKKDAIILQKHIQRKDNIKGFITTEK